MKTQKFYTGRNKRCRFSVTRLEYHIEETYSNDQIQQLKINSHITCSEFVFMNSTRFMIIRISNLTK